MDLLNNSTTYKKYLDRINEYKEISDKNQAFSTIKGRVETLSSDLKSKTDRDFYRHIHMGLLIVSLVIAIICIVKGMYVTAGFLLVAAAASKYFYTHTLKSLIRHTSEELKMENEQNAFDLKLFHHMQYLKNGIELKSVRIAIVRYSFMAIFPLILVSIVSLTNLVDSVSLFIQITLAALMGAMFWFYFFKDDLDELDYQEMELQEYIHDFMMNNPNKVTAEITTPTNEKEEPSINDQFTQLSVG